MHDSSKLHFPMPWPTQVMFLCPLIFLCTTKCYSSSEMDPAVGTRVLHPFCSPNQGSAVRIKLHSRHWGSGASLTRLRARNAIQSPMQRKESLEAHPSPYSYMHPPPFPPFCFFTFDSARRSWAGCRKCTSLPSRQCSSSPRPLHTCGGVISVLAVRRRSKGGRQGP